MNRDLYFMPVQINLLLLETGEPNLNLPLLDTDFNIYKGAHNEIEFFIRNQDRKPVNLIGKTSKIVVMNRGELLFEKYLKFVDECKGRVKIVLEPHEIDDFEVGEYQWSVLLIDEEGKQRLTYTNRNSEATGYLTIREGILPQLSEAIIVSEFVKKVEDRFTGEFRRTSGAVPGPAQAHNESGLVTFQVYLKNFTGRLWVQGTLEAQPQDYNDMWFEIPLHLHRDDHYFRNCSSVVAFNIKGQYSWIRFQWSRENEEPLGTNATEREREEDRTNNIVEKILVKV